MGPPLIQIIFFIAVNVVSPGQARFEISTPKGEVFTFTRQEDGGWRPSPIPEGGNGVWAIKGDMLKIMRPDGGSGLKMSQFFSDLGTIKWDTVTELTEGKTPIKLIRKGSEVTVLHGSSPNERKYVIRW